MSHAIALDVIEVQQPCPADWDAMQPTAGPARHCAQCQLPVHDLSQLTRAQTEALLHAATARLCVRFSRDEAGHVQTLDYAPRDPGRRRRRWRLLAIFLAGFTTASGGALWKSGLLGRLRAKPPITSTAIMGKIGVSRPQSPACTAPVMGAIAPPIRSSLPSTSAGGAPPGGKMSVVPDHPDEDDSERGPASAKNASGAPKVQTKTG